MINIASNCYYVLQFILLRYLIKYETIDAVNISKSFDGSCDSKEKYIIITRTHNHTYIHTHKVLSALWNNWSILMINELSEHNYPSNKRTYLVKLQSFIKRFPINQRKYEPTDSPTEPISPELNLSFKMKCKKPSSSSCVGSFLYESNT